MEDNQMLVDQAIVQEAGVQGEAHGQGQAGGAQAIGPPPFIIRTRVRFRE